MVEQAHSQKLDNTFPVSLAVMLGRSEAFGPASLSAASSSQLSTCNPPSQLKIIAAIPCFNTESSIASVVEKTKKYVNQVIVINDGSIDRTKPKAVAAGAKVISHRVNRGKGAAMKTAGENVEADILVFIDGDGQHDPDDIPKLIEPILQGKADFVIGSRFLAASKTYYVPLGRKVANWVASIVISFVISALQPAACFIGRRRSPEKQETSGWKTQNKFSVGSALYSTNLRVLNGKTKWITDCTSGFTAMKKGNWDRLSLVSDGFEIETEMILEQAKNGFVIAETPISCSWEGSLSKLSVGKDGLKTLRLLVRKLADYSNNKSQLKVKILPNGKTETSP